MPVFSTTSVRLEFQRNLSHAKTNLVFEAGHVTWKLTYFLFAKALSHTLSLSTRNNLAATNSQKLENM